MRHGKRPVSPISGELLENVNKFVATQTTTLKNIADRVEALTPRNETPACDWNKIRDGLVNAKEIPSMELPLAFFGGAIPKPPPPPPPPPPPDPFVWTKACLTVFGASESNPTTMVQVARQPALFAYPGYALSVNVQAQKQYIARLYLADLVWLYFHEKMGVFQILNKLVDDYTRSGRLTVRCTDTQGLERLTRKIQSGEGSSARERSATYVRSLGWKGENLPDAGTAQSNPAFDPAWRNFLRLALTYYRGRNVSNILASGGTQSTASVVSASDAAKALWQTFAPFETASNYATTFHGLAWMIVTLREIETIMPKAAPGVDASNEGSSICAAYEMLVLGQNPRGQDTSRYVVHNDCARYARKILLDLQGIKANPADDTLLTNWIQDPETEKNVEGYRSAWLRLTSEDLGPVANVRMTSG